MPKDGTTYFNGKPVRTGMGDVRKTEAQEMRNERGRQIAERAGPRRQTPPTDNAPRETRVQRIARRVLPGALKPGDKVKGAGDRILGRGR